MSDVFIIFGIIFIVATAEFFVWYLFNRFQVDDVLGVIVTNTVIVTILISFRIFGI